MPEILRAVAEYQMLGGDEEHTHASILTESLQAGKDGGYLVGFQVVAVHASLHFSDLALCQFTADFPLLQFDGQSPESTEIDITNILNDVIGDTDVDVRWLTRKARQ